MDAMSSPRLKVMLEEMRAERNAWREQAQSAHSTPKVRTMKTLVAVAILAMVLIPPALAKAKRAQSTRAQSAPQQGYQSSERPGYYHGYPLSEWYRDSLSSY